MWLLVCNIENDIELMKYIKTGINKKINNKMKIHTWLGYTRSNGLWFHYLNNLQQTQVLHQYRPSSQSPTSEKLPSQSQTTTSGNEDVKVVSFRRFIPLHVAFLNKPTSPKYLDNTFTNSKFKVEHDSDLGLGAEFKTILETHVKSGLYYIASNVLRNAI